MRLHEALEATTTGKVRRQVWRETWYASQVREYLRCDTGLGLTAELDAASILATDWEPVPLERDEWEKEALRVLRCETCGKSELSGDGTLLRCRRRGVNWRIWKDATCPDWEPKGDWADIRKHAPPPLDVERLAREVGERLQRENVTVWRSLVERAIVEQAAAQQKGK